MPLTALGSFNHTGLDGATNQIKVDPAAADPAVVDAINACFAAVNADPATTAIQVVDSAGNQITITGPWSSGQVGPAQVEDTWAVSGTAYTGSDPEILASIAADGTLNPAAETLTFNHIAGAVVELPLKEQLVAEGICTEEDIANAEAALACFDTLFGQDQGLDEALLCALLDSKVKDALLYCLTQDLEVEVTLTKQDLAEAIQNADIDADGDIAVVVGTMTLAKAAAKRAVATEFSRV